MQDLNFEVFEGGFEASDFGFRDLHCRSGRDYKKTL